MSYLTEIKEAFTMYTDGDSVGTLELIKSVIEEIEELGIEEYKIEFETDLYNEGLCKECFGDLKEIVVGHDLIEVWGRVEQVEEYALLCEQCGALYDN